MASSRIEQVGHWRPRSAILKFRALAALVAIDCFSIFAAFAATAYSRGSIFETAWFPFITVAIPVYLTIANSLKAFSPATLQLPLTSIRQALTSLALAVGASILIIFYLKAGENYPRLTIAIGSAAAAMLLTLNRYWFVTNLEAVIGGNPFSAILILEGDQPVPAGRFSLTLAAESYFDPESHDPVMYDRLANSLAGVGRVVIACAPERRMAWAHALQGANIQGEISMPEIAPLGPLGMGADRHAPSIIVAAGPLNMFDRVQKRIFDLVIAVPALVILSPVLIIIAIWIKIDSPGPVLFKQVRIGRSNRHFTMYKFRSMRSETSDARGDRLTLPDDDRVTRIGKFIRKTSIDELPQLIQVLTGDMSIVGPRPHALGARAATKLYWEVDSRYWHRHATKPGLTGLAQIRGFRGNTMVEDDLRNRLEADLEYLQSWSLWRDVKIMLLTTLVMVHRNAF
jgi:lipopolysaccharide/colanic/teichoic acid biosynthesis glycosyltransferase